MRPGKRFILALDQGTTGSRAILYDREGHVHASAYQEFTQFYPAPGWVEHDAAEIVESIRSVIKKALRLGGVSGASVAAIGITNQRETTVLWDRKTGKPLRKAIVWQDRRSESICKELKKRGIEEKIRQKTGLLLDSYFSGTKLTWLFRHSASLKRAARSGKVAFGTIDSWLLYKLTGGRVHATDLTNASRTLLYNIRTHQWDPWLLRILEVPHAVLPKALPSNHLFGHTRNFAGLPDDIPIHAIIGDQQAALYGQGCYQPGEAKNTYGTGCFLLVNTGKRYAISRGGLLTTIACDRLGHPVYALEGAVFIAGAVIQWLRDGLKIIAKASETEKIARQSKGGEEVMVIPAFTGLGAPHWRSDVRGAIFGITRGTTKEMVVKAALRSIAYQVSEVVDLMRRDGKVVIRDLRVDGGASENRYLMQFQADVLGCPVLKTSRSESTAWGAGKLAGIASGYWKNINALDRHTRYTRFSSKMKKGERQALLTQWKEAVRKLLS